MPTLETIISKNGIPIRLTDERWAHIIESHDYMAGNINLVLETVANPDKIVKGSDDACIALKEFDETTLGKKHAVVIYREEIKDGFIITAFLTSKPTTITDKGVVWSKPEK